MVPSLTVLLAVWLLCVPPGAASLPEKLVLFWTMDWFPYEAAYPLAALRQPRCPLPCRFTSQRERLNASDVVVFHAFFVDLVALPARRAGQRRALWNLEPPPHVPTAVQARPTNGLFDWIVSYQATSDVSVQPYLLAPVDARRPHAAFEPDGDRCVLRAPWHRARRCPVPDAARVAGKTKLVAWFVSNCAPGGGRMSFVRELQRHVHVDVYGACGELTCGTPGGAASPDCYRMLERDYFFYLAFENSLCADYATEKLFNVLRYDVVPVVFGGAAYQRLAPPGAVLDALALAPRQLALRMVQLAAEPAAYLAHLRWKGSRVLVHDPAAWACELCRRAHGGDVTRRWAEVAGTDGGGGGRRRDIVDWHGILGRCQRYDGDGRISALFW